ncbi:3-deoxy-manno-octulosonate-8-phosphatase KdsC [Aliidiomarina quisquiliarum]|uniref:3-deoxy-manno-octulosonate-8-phosphatase KdsC n=1 Tax=Aliidiomarina quisquiliarum TaxID=2938947 RepID=UPI00208EE049|nr:3-deoxy-manno-octulosonate-8-phosphatase KdsC [Aliidiomarina quisquiliarum]MCO4321429.1 3-deoxy-manno-octulosonate-8-phosphatase KdsC [Aliidiomarina quisquiliarum]
MVSTWYGNIAPQLLQKLAQIKVLVCDIDGVFSDGRIYLGNNGEELKTFHTRDGLGVKALRSAGIEVAVITGRTSNIVHERMTALGVPFIYQGQEQKEAPFAEILDALGLTADQAAYIGDDSPDLPLIQLAGLGVAPFDAHPAVQHAADYVTTCRGGFGAVREIADLILLGAGKLHQVMESST